MLGSEAAVAPEPVAAPVRTFGEDFDVPAAAADDTPTEAPTRRRWLSPGAAAVEDAPALPPEPVVPAPRVKLGGTLFERMSSVSRGVARDEEPTPDKDALDIPRFLHRQNNQ